MTDISQAEIRVESIPVELRSELGKSSVENSYVVTIGGQVLRTPAGRLITHHDVRAMRELAAELEYTDDLNVTQISLFNLLATQVDFIETSSHEVPRDDVDQWLLRDPVLKICAGPEMVDQLKYLHVVVSYLKYHGIVCPSLPQCPLQDHSAFSEETEENFNLLVSHIHAELSNLNVFSRTVFRTVHHVFDSPILGILLATHQVSPHEFAVTYLTTLCINSKVWSDGDRSKERDMLQSVTRDVECMERYLNRFGLTEIDRLIACGESKQLEFKSTLRWNLHSDASDSRIEHAVLKTVVAFLNTDGGKLLIGVNDEGECVGIEADKFANEDRYLLHFTNLVNDRIGKQFAGEIHWELVPFQTGRILKVTCNRSPNPAFLKSHGKEQFYIRTGPSTVELSASEIMNYGGSRFKS
jgi:hypothetical protein